jgi:phosphoglycerate dehydrogenase-like enzyme
MRILFCGDTFPAARQKLQSRLTSPDDEIAVCAGDDIAGAMQGVDVLLPLMCRIDAAIMDAGCLRLIQQWGAGIEGVDLHAAAQRGIQVANVPATGSNADSVAELVILLIIALLRDFPAAQASVKAGRLGTPIGRMLASRTVCLYGLGAIARSLAPRLRPFNVRLVGITRDPAASKVAEFGLDACFPVEQSADCLARTDILVICTRLSQDTRGVIDHAALAALPRGAYLVNAARGAIVDYEALYGALASGHLAGAGLDVYWKEPIAPSDPLLALPNVIALPHIGGVTHPSYEEIAEVVASNIERLRAGNALLHRVTA